MIKCVGEGFFWKKKKVIFSMNDNFGLQQLAVFHNNVLELNHSLCADFKKLVSPN